MNKQPRNSGPRCAICNRPYQPRQMRDGNWSQTCGQTACVAAMSRRKSSNSFNHTAPRRPQNAW